MGEKSDVEYYANALENAGFTEEEAKKMALKEFFLNNPVRNSTTAFVSNAIVSGANSAASGYRKYEDVDETAKLTEIGKAEAIELQNKKENVIIKEIEECGVIGDISMHPEIIDITDFSFDSTHINNERGHNVERAEVEELLFRNWSSFCGCRRKKH